MYTKETKIFIVLLAVALIIAILIAYYIYTIIVSYKLEIQRGKQFLFTEIQILEKERERIAQNLHDNAGPELSLLKLNLDELNIRTEEDTIAIDKVKAHIDKILNNLRRISHNLMPNSLLREGINPALHDLTTKLSNKGLQIEFESEQRIDLPIEISIHLYRMMEEFIYNTIKHAQASRIKIQLSRTETQFQLLARDNGIGFNSNSQTTNPKGMGLKGYEYRTELIGGTFSVYSELGKGTQLQITIPI